MKTYADRQRANDASRNQADHHTEPWADAELEVLRMWNGHADSELDALAEVLGRTREACRQKFYLDRKEPSNGRPKGNRVTVTTFHPCERCWLVPCCCDC